MSRNRPVDLNEILWITGVMGSLVMAESYARLKVILEEKFPIIIITCIKTIIVIIMIFTIELYVLLCSLVSMPGAKL